MRFTSAVLLGAMALANCGCLQYASLLEVNGDGGGTLTVRCLVSQGTDNIFGIKLGERESEDSSQEAVDKVKANFDQFAGSLGEGVTLIEQKEIVTKGWNGIQAKFKVNDVNSLRLSGMPPRSKDTGEDENEESINVQVPVYRFRFDKAEPNKLVISTESSDKKETASGEEDPFAEVGLRLDDSPTATASFGHAIAAQVAKVMLKGARMTALVKVNGEITKTNAKHRMESGAIVIQDYNLGKLAEADLFEQVIHKKIDFDELVKKNAPYLKAIASDQQIEIEFTTRN